MREKDGAIAALIFKFSIGIRKDSEYFGCDELCYTKDPPFRTGMEKIDTISGPCLIPIEQRVPGYSTDISKAWLVVEEMLRKDGITFEMRKAACGFVCNFIPDKNIVEWAETAPEAICDAALLAMEYLSSKKDLES